MAPTAKIAASQVLDSGYIGEGKFVEDFERSLSNFLQISPESVVALNSATSGLSLAVKMLNLPPGSEILTTSLTCIATNSCILENRLKPVWVDIDDSLNMDPIDLESKINGKSRAIMVVHFGGNPAKLNNIKKIADEHDLVVLQDCAHSIGVEYDGRMLADEGSVFSFQAIKPLTTVDGGALIAKESDRARRLRWYGIDRKDRGRPVDEIGTKFHMNNVSAAIGLENILHLSSNIVRNRENARYFSASLKEHSGWRPTLVHSESNPNFYLFPILVDSRDDFIRCMKDRGIETAPVHRAHHNEPCFRDFKNSTPNLERIDQELVCLPVGWWVGEKEREQICEAFNRGW